MTTTPMIAPNRHVVRPWLRSASPAAVMPSAASASAGMWCEYLGTTVPECATAPMFPGRTHADTIDTANTIDTADSKRVDPGTLRGGLT